MLLFSEYNRWRCWIIFGVGLFKKLLDVVKAEIPKKFYFVESMFNFLTVSLFFVLMVRLIQSVPFISND